MLFLFWQVFDIIKQGDSMKNKGFTLIELLAVIAVLGVILTIATTNVYRYLSDSKVRLSNIARNSLNDAGISYALNYANISNACAITFIPDSLDINVANGCSKVIVTVKELKDKNLFSDDKETCNESSQILVYKYLDPTYNSYDYYTYIPDSVCR
jgi:prepilin-type N-terminal cleavage/methylation domain-containing protein